MSTKKSQKSVAPRLVQLETRDVPATFYVDPALATPQDGKQYTFNAGAPNEVKGLTFGATATTPNATLFSSLKVALEKAANSTGADTILLADGSITVDNSAGAVTIADQITLTSRGKQFTTLVPAADTADELTGVVEVLAANFSLTVSQVTFDGAGKQVGSAFYIDSGKGTFDGVTIQNVKFANDFGVGITAAPDSFVNVLSSKFTGYNRIGVSYVDSDGWVVGNTFTGRGPGTGVNYGVQIIGDSFVELHFNTITAHQSTTPGFDSAGITLYEDLNKAPAATIRNNTFASNTYGVLVGADKTTDDTTVTITRNNFATSNGFGVGALSARLVNAQRNYWGSKLGAFDPNPADNSLNAGAPGAPVTTGVDYGFWLKKPFEVGEGTPGIAVGSGSGTAGGTASLYKLDGTLLITTGKFGGFGGEVRVASGDFDGDGFPDLVRTFGPGVGSRVQMYNGKTGSLIREFDAYGTFAQGGGFTSFSGGVYVATGDVDGDGVDDVVTGAGAGFAPIVKVFSGKTGVQIREFTAFKEFNSIFAGGVTVASADLNNDGFDDIVTGTATGSNAVFGYDSFYNPNVGSGIYFQFYAFSESFTGGVNVAAGDMNGDRRAEVFAGQPSNTGPSVFGWTTNNNGTRGSQSVIFSVTTDKAVTPGARVAARDLDDDGAADLILGYGVGAGSDTSYRLVNGKLPLGTGNPPSPIGTSNPIFGAGVTGIFVG